MRVPRPAFREHDVRGVADRDLPDALARALGAAFGTMLADRVKRPARVAIARDCRVSSTRLHAALVRGATEAGVAIVDLGVGPTPLLVFGVQHLGTDGGVMVTGSEGAADENGFKLLAGKTPFIGPDLQMLADAIERERVIKGGGSVESGSVQGPFLDALTSRVRPFAHPVKIILDAGNGSGGPLGLEALRRAGADVVAIGCDMDGRFPNHPPNPRAIENARDVIAMVKRERADFGVAFDGDASTLGVVDAAGERVPDEALRALFARADEIDRPPPSMRVNAAEFGFGSALASALRLAEIVATRGLPLAELARS